MGDAAREGGCLCGAVRYSISGEPLVTAVCHCTHCQKQGGSAFSVVAVVTDAQYSQSGETRVYADRGDSGKGVERHFCGNCGSPIVSLVEAMPGLTMVKAGTLDDPRGLNPTQEVWCGSAWDAVPPFAGTTRVVGAS